LSEIFDITVVDVTISRHIKTLLLDEALSYHYYQ